MDNPRHSSQPDAWKACDARHMPDGQAVYPAQEASRASREASQTAHDERQAQTDAAYEASQADHRAPDAHVHQKLAQLAAEDSDLDPYEIEFLPEFRQGRGPKGPFVNEYGVVIGDHMYDSPESPLNKWSKDTDPAIMAGDQWVHPFKDIGFQTEENKDLFERGIPPQGGIFTHPDKDVAYEANRDPGDDDSPPHA